MVKVKKHKRTYDGLTDNEIKSIGKKYGLSDKDSDNFVLFAKEIFPRAVSTYDISKLIDYACKISCGAALELTSYYKPGGYQIRDGLRKYFPKLKE